MVALTGIAVAFWGAIRSLAEALVMSLKFDVGRALAGGRDMHGKLVFRSIRQLTFSRRSFVSKEVMSG